ncbi:MAG: hypothetical protein GY946_20730, partial [bacterium]|nr:hypothetical protein [bacterium]
MSAVRQKGRPEKPPGDGEKPALGGFGVNAGIVAEIRERYTLDPGSVDASWAELFGEGQGRRGASSPARQTPPPKVPTQADATEGSPRPGMEGTADAPHAIASPQVAEKHARVLRLIHAYRARGHRIADSNPLGNDVREFPELDPAHYGLGDGDLDQLFFAGDLPGGPIQTLGQILDRLRSTYCRKIGIEFTHIQDPGQRQWLLQQMEEHENDTTQLPEERLRILEK